VERSRIKQWLKGLVPETADTRQNEKKYPGIRRQMRLRIERTSDRIDRKVFGLEFVKRGDAMSIGLW
jgi:hypothetical protein